MIYKIKIILNLFNYYFLYLCYTSVEVVVMSKKKVNKKKKNKRKNHIKTIIICLIIFIILIFIGLYLYKYSKVLNINYKDRYI